MLAPPIKLPQSCVVGPMHKSVLSISFGHVACQSETQRHMGVPDINTNSVSCTTRASLKQWLRQICVCRRVPALTRSADLVALEKRRPMLPSEYFHALNVPVWGSGDSRCSHICTMRGRFMRTCTLADAQALAGNGMNLAAVGSVLMFCLASVTVADVPP